MPRGVTSVLSPDGEPLAVCVRDAFVAPPGRVLLAADYKQLEMRLFAAFSNDPQLQREVRAGGAAGGNWRRPCWTTAPHQPPWTI